MKLRRIIIALPFAVYAACGGGDPAVDADPRAATLTYAKISKATCRSFACAFTVLD